jgi:hypothetical protein
MLYHYTDRASAADICRERVIRAAPLRLHRDLLARDIGMETVPLVWLTTNPVLEGTVAAKMLSAGWPSRLTGDLWRFTVAETVATQSLPEFVQAQGMDPSWWQWTVRTAALAFSDYSMWRVSLADIAQRDWKAVEALAAFTEAGDTIWKSL